MSADSVNILRYTESAGFEGEVEWRIDPAGAWVRFEDVWPELKHLRSLQGESPSGTTSELVAERPQGSASESPAPPLLSSNPKLDYVEALRIATAVFETYRTDWPSYWRKMDGTPILNDLPVRIAQAFANWAQLHHETSEESDPCVSHVAMKEYEKALIAIGRAPDLHTAQRLAREAYEGSAEKTGCDHERAAGEVCAICNPVQQP